MNSLLLVAGVLLCSVAVYTIELDYGIMIDAGSSGSRIYLYEWPHRNNDTLPLVEPTSINQTVVSMKINVALSSFDGNASYAGESLAPLIAYIQANLNRAKWSATPIYLKATAGMRALSQTSQDQIIADVRSYLVTTPFKFNSTFARVIPGTDEGVYGWITTNYAMQLLAEVNPTTYGALDMGGASTQITYEPLSAPTSNNYTLTLGESIYPLYVYSYPLGQDQAGRLLLAGLLADGVVDGNGNILNPCYLTGYNETYLSGPTLTVGTGDFTACQQAVRKYIVTTDSSCSSCGIGSVYQPPVNGNYYAFSGFAYTAQFFNLPNTSTIGDLQSAGQAFCANTFSQAQATYPTQAVIYLRNYCFTSIFLSEVLLKYGFSATSHAITTTVGIGSIELTWALGGMIYEANLLPFGSITPSSDSSTVVASMVVLLFALTAVLL